MTHLPPHIGEYEILGLLGTGGMAEVFLGRFKGPADFQRPVVVKRILPHLARQKNFVNMFRDEARIAARINHRNVVQVHELGEDEDELYLVMEYLGGESAAGIARQLARRKKLMSFGLCAHLLGEVCAGLHAAHELRDETGRPLHIVHRDVSPANIFITYEGSVKILDFGIAVAANRLSITDAGQVKGKYAYMSPEQCRGKKLDRRSDIFSIGTVLYELSTCRRLFKRSSDMETLDAICSDSILPPSRLVNNYPPELEQICLKALQNDPENRYATAAEMRGDLVELARVLNKDKVPERALAKVMRRLFSDRMLHKQRMLK
ncbi:MAG: serine/threonine-protein kinase, partial [Myxococcota bacterium]